MDLAAREAVKPSRFLSLGRISGRIAGGVFVWEGLGLDGVLVCMGLSGHGRELQKEVDGAFDW